MMVLLVLLGCGIGIVVSLLALFLLNFRIKCRPLVVDENNSTKVIDVIDALWKIVPINSSTKWTLNCSSHGLRCWQRTFPLTLVNSNTNVCGASVVINSSSEAVLNVIASEDTWPEWLPSFHQRSYRAELCEDVEIRGDRYMQCDQIVAQSVIDKNKSGILMHRFGRLENNGIGWILLWHVMELNWSFFLAQPIESSSGVASRCLLTKVKSLKPPHLRTEDPFEAIVNCLQNLKEAVEISHLSVRPFLSPKSPTLIGNMSPTKKSFPSSPFDDLPEKCHFLLSTNGYNQLSKEERENSVFTIVPFGHRKPVTLDSLRGFVVVVGKLTKALDSPTAGDKKKAKLKRRRHSSSNSLGMSPRRNLKNGEDQGSKTEPTSYSGPPTRPSTPDGHSSEGSLVTSTSHNSRSHTKQPSHNFLTTIFQRRRSTSAERKSSSPTKTLPEDHDSGASSDAKHASMQDVSNSKMADDDTKMPNGKMGGQGNGSVVAADKKADDSGCEEIEFPVPNLKLPDETFDYVTVGKKGIVELLKEVSVAPKLNCDLDPEEFQTVVGEWVYHGTHKDVMVLMKFKYIGGLNTVCYLSRGEIPVKPALVWETLCSPMSRYVYDETIKKISVIQDLANKQKILYTYHESITLLKKECQDFCVLQTESAQNNDRFILSMQSTEFEACPFKSDVTRGLLLPSGWVLEPSDERGTKTLVTYVIQMAVGGTDSLLAEEIGNTQPQCISNLRSYLSAKPN